MLDKKTYRFPDGGMDGYMYMAKLYITDILCFVTWSLNYVASVVYGKNPITR